MIELPILDFQSLTFLIILTHVPSHWIHQKRSDVETSEVEPEARVLRHGTAAGGCSCESNAVRFDEATRYQHACRENFILDLGRYCMDKRNIYPNVNLFMKVPTDATDDFAATNGISAPGTYVDLIADTDPKCLFSNCLQIDIPYNGFNPTQVQVLVWDMASAL